LRLIKRLVIILACSLAGTATMLAGLQSLTLGLGVKAASLMAGKPWVLPVCLGSLAGLGLISQLIMQKTRTQVHGPRTAPSEDGEPEAKRDETDTTNH